MFFYTGFTGFKQPFICGLFRLFSYILLTILEPLPAKNISKRCNWLLFCCPVLKYAKEKYWNSSFFFGYCNTCILIDWSHSQTFRILKAFRFCFIVRCETCFLPNRVLFLFYLQRYSHLLCINQKYEFLKMIYEKSKVITQYFSQLRKTK